MTTHTCTREEWNGCEACLEDALREMERPQPEDTYSEWEWL